MKNRKYVYMLLIFMLCMITISAASAAEDAASDISSIENEELILEESPSGADNLNEANEELILDQTPDEESLSVEDENNPLTATGTFKALDSLINNNDDSEINLTRNFTYSGEDDLTGGIIINRTLTINGNGYTIDASNKTRIFQVTSSNVVFKNITFTNGKSYYAENGGAILGASTVINCTFINNQAYNGGAMYEGTAINSTFIGNSAQSGGGGAIYGGKAINSTFISNKATYGGAMEEGIAINSTFRENQAVQGGAGYEFNAINCNFTDNHASYLGALFLGFAINSYFKDNYIDGGYEENVAVGEAVVINCTFINNTYEDCEFCQNITINIENYTGKSYESNYIEVNVKTDSGKDFENIVVTINVYEDGELVDTGMAKSGSYWQCRLPEGEYVATASIEGASEIESVNFTIKLTKDPVEIDVNDTAIIYNTVSNLTATLYDAGPNPSPLAITHVITSLDGIILQRYTDENGSVSIPLKDLSLGIHNATFLFLGDDTRERTRKDVKIFVVNNIAIIECKNPYVAKYNNTVSYQITVTDEDGNPISGERLYIDLFEGETFITSKSGTFIVDSSHFQKLAAGNYTATIGFGDNFDYGPSKTINITIEKQATSLSSNDFITTFRSGEKIVATLTNEQGNPISGAELKVIIIDNETFTTDANGQIEIPINNLALGEYDAQIAFAGNENYTASNQTVHITITQAISQLFADNITTPADIAKDFTIILKDSKNNPLPNVKIMVCLDDIEEKTTDENGEVIISTEGLEARKYNVFFFYYGNENYTASSGKAIINILEATAIINITAVDINYGEEAKINFTLTDSKGNGLNGDLNVIIGEINTTVPVVNGFGNTTITGLNANNYTVIANYFSDADQIKSTASAKLNVAKIGTQILFENMDTTAVAQGDPKTGEWFIWTLKDSNGKPMPNIPMQIGFNGVIYDEKNGIVTDENGTAKLQINLGYKGAYTFAICFLGDDNHNASFAVAKITVATQTPTLSVPNKSYKASAKTKALTATFKTVKGTAIANKQISFTVNGKTYKAKTNEKGVASVNVSITKKGSYAVTAKYAGDSTYSAVTKKATLKIS